MAEKLALEWSYTPADFFEGQVDCTEADYTVHIEDRRVVATFRSDQPGSVFPWVHKEVKARFLGAQPMRNKPFRLSGYNTRRTRPDGTATIGVSASLTLHAEVDAVDVVVRDAAGDVKTDTQIEEDRGDERICSPCLKTQE